MDQDRSPKKRRRATPAQFEVMVQFMEKHGDLYHLPDGRDVQNKRWKELTVLLNKQSGATKTLHKWRQSWSDFKTFLSRKAERLKTNPCERIRLTDIERRAIKIMKLKPQKCRSPEIPVIADFDEIENNMKMEIMCENSNPSNLYPPQLDDEESDCWPQRIRQTQKKEKLHKKPVNSHTESSSDISSPEPHHETNDTANKNEEPTINHVLEKILDFERDRERQAHEREMARVRQSDMLLDYLGRVVNVIETLAPSVKMYLERDKQDGKENENESG